MLSNRYITRIEGVGVAYSAEATALFARFSTPPDAARKLLIDNLIVSLKDAGVWSKLDALYVMAAADAQAAQRNWIGDIFNLTPQDSPTFAADRGYTGDGSTSYLNTGFNPSTAVAPKYTITSGHIGLVSRTNLANGAGDSFDMGGSVRTFLARSVAASGTMLGRIQTATKDLATSAYPGHGVASRTASNVWEGYAQGVDAGGAADANASIGNETWRILSTSAATFGVNQIAAGHFGSGLSAAEVLALYNALNSYMTAVGAAPF